jgi:hypothetical protein
MIMLIHPGARRGTWFHCTGALFDRELTIEPNNRFDSWGVKSKHCLGQIPVCFLYCRTRGREGPPTAKLPDMGLLLDA